MVFIKMNAVYKKISLLYRYFVFVFYNFYPEENAFYKFSLMHCERTAIFELKRGNTRQDAPNMVQGLHCKPGVQPGCSFRQFGSAWLLVGQTPVSCLKNGLKKNLSCFLFIFWAKFQNSCFLSCPVNRMPRPDNAGRS